MHQNLSLILTKKAMNLVPGDSIGCYVTFLTDKPIQLSVGDKAEVTVDFAKFPCAVAKVHRRFCRNPNMIRGRFCNKVDEYPLTMSPEMHY